VQGGAAFANAYQGQQQTERQRALQKLELAQNFANQGVDLSDEDMGAINQAVDTGEIGAGFKSLLNRQAQSKRSTNEYEKQIKSLDLESKRASIDKTRSEIEQSKLPFAQSKEAQKLAYAEELKNKAAMSGAAVNKTQIDEIARKNANVFSVKSGIDSALAQLQSDLPEEEKIKVGQNLLKLLNSAEGSDAVGAEESKRLGSFLEWKFANFTQPGSFIGRDLDLFTQQVANKSKELADRITRNESGIKGLQSGQSIGQINQATPSRNMVLQPVMENAPFAPSMPSGNAYASPFQSLPDNQLLQRRQLLMQKAGR
jgi:hypothetical protein